MKPYYDDGAGIVIYNADCREILPALPKVDLVLTDPPYGTGGWRRGGGGAGSDPTGQLVVEHWDTGAVDWIACVSTDRVMSFFPAGRAAVLLGAAVQHGFSSHRACYMRKVDPKPMPAGRTRWSIEPVWILGRTPFAIYGDTDWMDASTPRMNRDADATGHPYQKPVEVIAWLLAKVPSAQAILDPFMGSGTTLVAAKRLGRKCIGIEIEEKYCEIAARRVEAERLTLFEHVEAKTGDLFGTGLHRMNNAELAVLGAQDEAREMALEDEA